MEGSHGAGSSSGGSVAVGCVNPAVVTDLSEVPGIGFQVGTHVRFTWEMTFDCALHALRARIYSRSCIPGTGFPTSFRGLMEIEFTGGSFGATCCHLRYFGPSECTPEKALKSLCKKAVLEFEKRGLIVIADVNYKRYVRAASDQRWLEALVQDYQKAACSDQGWNSGVLGKLESVLIEYQDLLCIDVSGSDGGHSTDGQPRVRYSGLRVATTPEEKFSVALASVFGNVRKRSVFERLSGTSKAGISWWNGEFYDGGLCRS